MAKPPSVSVLMPFYDDGSKRTRALFSSALSSVLAQTFRDFEVVVVASGEKDFARKQSARSKKIRLSFFEQEKMGYGKIPLKEKVRGIVTARNLCLRRARGRLVAFADYDDLSLPGRLRAEYDFLERHPEIGAVGSQMVLIDADGNEVGVRGAFEDDGEIRRRFVQFNTVPQPTLMARLAIVKQAGAFRLDGIPEDFDLWVRMAKLTLFHNLQVPLVKYRVHSGGGATIYKFPLYLGSLRVKMKAARELGLRVGVADVLVNIFQFVSLFFPEGVRRTVLEGIRSRVVIARKN
ncbi:MAG: glycosyltransferase [Candidatus Micrarchaeia archaeon]|jgi:glycosyltransferase involved in cell wall biosynthesis